MKNIHTLNFGLKDGEEVSSLPRKWLNLKQAAEYLGTTPRAIEAYVLKGKLSCYKPFGRLLFDVVELETVVKASRK